MEETTQQNTAKRKKHEYDWGIIKDKLPIAVLVFVTFCCCMVVIFLMFRYSAIAALMSKLVDAIRPILIGLIWGYLLNPAMKWMEGLLLKVFLPRSRHPEKTRKRVRSAASIIAVVLSVVLIAGLIWLLIPALVESVSNFVDNFRTNVTGFTEWLESLDIIKNFITVDLETTLINIGDDIVEWVQTNVLTEAQGYIATVTGTVKSVVSVLIDVLVGFVVAVYVLMDKERFEGQIKKMIYAILPVKPANVVVEVFHKCNEIFSGFIVGKVIDSAIIGVICFVVCSIVRMPYTPVVSVIVGVTNMIQFFGPFIGAIPCIILITLTDPIYGLYFIIFILILQQIDGNIIGPKILGDSTGLTSFWVIFAVLVGGTMWGLVGLLFGVPIFAFVYYLIRRAIDHFARVRDVSGSSLEFTTVEYMDEQTGEFTYDPKRMEREAKIQALIGTKTKREDKES